MSRVIRLLVAALAVAVMTGATSGNSPKEHPKRPTTVPLGIRYLVEAKQSSDGSWWAVYEDRFFVREKQKASLQCKSAPYPGKALRVYRRVFTDGTYLDLAECVPPAPPLVPKGKK
jgi:hypothetical protein